MIAVGVGGEVVRVIVVNLHTVNGGIFVDDVMSIHDIAARTVI